jgi:sorbose reductase
LAGKAYQVNVRDPQIVADAVDEIVKEFNGRLDVFVANSGIPWTQGPMLEGDLDHYRKVVSTDIDGTFYSARAAAKHWRRQKLEGTDIYGKELENFTTGSFVATASMSGHIVNIPQLQAAYNAAKAAVIMLCPFNLLFSRRWTFVQTRHLFHPRCIAVQHLSDS